MKAERFERIEALVSIIEEQTLLIHENAALAAYYDRAAQRTADRLRKRNKEGLVYFLNETTIRWKNWLAESSNVYAYNLFFYKARLKDLLEE
jgi:hypothetical protein